MADIANPPRRPGTNGTFSASGWGVIHVKITSIGHGMSVVSTTSQGRRGRSLYVTRRTSGSFGLQVMCSSYESYKELGEWIQGYGRRLADGAGATVGPVRVTCPSRNFDKIAVPSGVSFGDTVHSHTYPVSINFLGTSDPLPLTALYSSSFVLPSNAEPSLPYFYPGGTQLTGDETGVDSMFDSDLIATPTGVDGPVQDGTRPANGPRAV